MNVPSELAGLSGSWLGTNRLWLTPDEPVRQSVASAEVSLAAQGKFFSLNYTWSEGGEDQAGLLLAGFNATQGTEQAAWIDSWHMNDQIMLCKGEWSSGGSLLLKGSYAAPPGPDWGWQIEIEPVDETTFKLVMHNLTPEGQAFLAVEAILQRSSS